MVGMKALAEQQENAPAATSIAGAGADHEARLWARASASTRS
jgi:hypothetical protein